MNRERLVPFPAWMTDHLAARVEEVGRERAPTFKKSGLSRNELGLMFPTNHGRIPRRSNWNRRVITPARVRAEWPGEKIVERDEHGQERVTYDWQWSWHSLRHLFCSHAVSKDGLDLDPEVAARIAGHSPDVFRRMYCDAPPDSLSTVRERMRYIPSPAE